MPVASSPSPRPLLALACLASLLLHLAVLFLPRQAPTQLIGGTPPLQARLVPPPSTVQGPAEPDPVVARPKASTGKSVLAVDKSVKNSRQRTVRPSWSAAEKNEMNRFLDELGAAARPAPSLAQRSVAMAREMARQQAQESEAALATVERLPNSPPIDPFGLEMYMDSLVKKLNRSAAHVRNDPRAQGVKVAAVQVRLHPNGSLHSFRVLNAADQQEEIGFIRRVVEQAVPFAAFPSDIQRSAKSLSLIICIMPPRAGGGGFGFTRHPDGRGC